MGDSTHLILARPPFSPAKLVSNSRWGLESPGEISGLERDWHEWVFRAWEVRVVARRSESICTTLRYPSPLPYDAMHL